MIKIFFLTQANNSNLHAATWQSWICIPYGFKSWVVLYLITFISCTVRQLSFPCHNALGHKSIEKIGILWWIVISLSGENHVVNSCLLFWRYKATCALCHLSTIRTSPLCNLLLGCSQPFLQVCVSFHNLDGGDIPNEVGMVGDKAEGWGSPGSPGSFSCPCP